MSIYDYDASKAISASDWPFASIIMAAMRKADTDNLEALRKAFPDIWTELQARYRAPNGGLLPGEENEYETP